MDMSPNQVLASTNTSTSPPHSKPQVAACSIALNIREAVHLATPTLTVPAKEPPVVPKAPSPLAPRGQDVN